MWPFKKSIPYSEVVKSYPPAPCGEQYKHYYWKEIEHFPCPHCLAVKHAKREHEAKLREEDRLADKIACAIVSKLSARGGVAR